MENTGFIVLYHPHIKKDLKSLSSREKDTFFKLMNHAISTDPRKGKKLKGKFSGLYKFRFGSYRIIYEIDSSLKTIYVLRARHRKDAYNNII